MKVITYICRANGTVFQFFDHSEEEADAKWRKAAEENQRLRLGRVDRYLAEIEPGDELIMEAPISAAEQQDIDDALRRYRERREAVERAAERRDPFGFDASNK